MTGPDFPAHGPVSAILLRAHVTVTCSCGNVFDAFLSPGPHILHSCEGCGTVHHLRLTSSPGGGGNGIAAVFTAETSGGEDGDG